MLQLPTQEEYPSYFREYVESVPEGSLLGILEKQLEETVSLLSGLTEEKANFAYVPGKWTLKEVIGHVTDTERIMSYRLLRIARGDLTPLPGFDEDRYVEGAAFTSRSIMDLTQEFKAVRQSTIALISGLEAETWTRFGVASEQNVSARAIAYIIAGHERHHVKIIKDRYLL
ncbi:DinB family protein [Sutcliffiella deserti]|uniref:DinB family protein n=1 Tax=Sutcliffiella deserti TaxID=2875501 RepID=UPI001CBF3C6A|nr:DinB family protein [Sutcliffiella deserti]